MTLILIFFALLGVPLFAVIAGVALTGFSGEGLDPEVVLIEFNRLAEMPVLASIPLFTFAGYLLGESGAPGRLVRMTEAFLGWMPGGLAVVALVACAFFTAFTGASGVTIIALGALLYPALIQAGYAERFALGLVTAGGSLGVLFAPSLPMILYGIVAPQMDAGRGVSIERLFAAGLVPGVFMLALLSAWCIREGWKHHVPPEEFSLRRIGNALRESAWELPLPFVVLGGIYGGKFAVSEAAAVTALYVFVVVVLIRREVLLRDLPELSRRAMMMVGSVLLILGFSIALMSWLIEVDAPGRLFTWVRQHVESPMTFLLALNGFLLVLGMMLDIFSAIVLVVPLILPIAAGYGIDPVHLGIVFLANMQIGYFTPPVGMNLFIASLRFERPVAELVRACVPWFFLMLASVLAITFWPGLLSLPPE